MQLVPALQKTALAAGALFVLGFGIQTSVGMPDYAPVYLDDSAKIFIALPCIDDWRSKRDSSPAIVRLARAREANRLRYKLDDDCREAGGYVDDDRSLSGLALVKLGLLPPKRHWWDKIYRTESGFLKPES